MRIGLISDTHIPWRALEIPRKFLDWFSGKEVNMIIHCGDVNDPKVLEILNNIAPTKAVKGNTDRINLPPELILKVSSYKIFIFHSDEVYPRGDMEQLYEWAKAKSADIVIFGHTHLPLFTYYKGVYFINPGTATGVRSGEHASAVKSVAILEIKNNNVNVEFKVLKD